MPHLLQPETLKEALGLLATQEGVRLLAGGTDLLVLMKQGVITCDGVIDIKHIDETRVFDIQDGQLRIGAAVTLAEIIDSALIPSSQRILQQAAGNLANTLVRNRATLVGNLCNASPGADMAGACLVLGATLVAASAKGERRIALSEFFTGVKKHALEPGEMALRVEFPLISGRGIYLKKRRIHGHDLAQVNVSGYYTDDHELRLALGAVATTPLLLDGFGRIPPEELLVRKDEIVEAAGKLARPISDVRATKEYRTAMVRYFTWRIVEAFASGKEAFDG